MEVDRIEISFEEDGGTRYVIFFIQFSDGSELRDRKIYKGARISMKFVEDLPEPHLEGQFN